MKMRSGMMSTGKHPDLTAVRSRHVEEIFRRRADDAQPTGTDLPGGEAHGPLVCRSPTPAASPWHLVENNVICPLPWVRSPALPWITSTGYSRVTKQLMRAPGGCRGPEATHRTLLENCRLGVVTLLQREPRGDTGQGGGSLSGASCPHTPM